MTDTPVVSGGARPTVRLDLYISGTSPDSAVALDNLRLACLERSGTPLPDVSIIDVNESPIVAFLEGVFVTPTLIVTINGVANTMFGNLANPETTRLLLARIM
jgi:hypothetical protein